ncbi:MAG: GDSL-type esterase/lipase family protein, partial [Oscillospiraceae bacterium]|nr:GDSL-type esterase/lipase family protein [Oscillospiraceae bacterium]
MQKFFKDGAAVLFQGDSITDCSRNRRRLGSLGNGYPAKAAEIYEILFPEHNVSFINKGLSGDRVRDLLSRYDKDILKLKPDFISILIGINDVWRAFDDSDPCPVERFEDEYTLLLDKIKTDLPECEIMMINLFLYDSDKVDTALWADDYEPKKRVIEKLSGKYADYFLDI